jgi:exopolyphosphatase/guanosine-5'-triphosphate,3'-diphosphate pyrophosphatase
MAPPERTETYAAVDLGSNSFHLLVARRKHGELRVLDRIREMVRIGGGLDKDGNLDEATSNRALDCLARFGQRLRGIPASNMRAVGTQTFRRLRKANSFLMVTETALGCPVDIIGGREEARLIYLGVSQGVSGHEDRRLVIDIGGGSTELVIGEGLEPMEMESLQFGCVSFTQWYFGNGELSRKRWEQARRGALAEMQELQIRYRDTGWKTAIGSSGTIRAVASICHARGWCERNITRPGLELLQKELLGFGTIDAIALPGLSERRKSVIVGGLAILSACFEALDLEELVVSPYALREGVLHDLLGRLEHRDPRDKTVQAFKLRYGVDPAQVERVRHTALRAFDQVAGALDLTQTHRDMLGWAADLHETGLSVSHSHYQRHSGYLVEESDMAGFSRQEQLFLAALVRYHRRAIPDGYAGSLPPRLHQALCNLLFLLRFSWILCRTRDDKAIPEFTLDTKDTGITARFEPEWIEGHPLTVTDLECERIQLGKLRLKLAFNRC